MLHADPCRILDYKLRNVAHALKSWSMKRMGSVKLQLAAARELVLMLDRAMDSRAFIPEEVELRRRLKFRCLGLASLCRTIARQRSRIQFLAEGGTNTRFFHLQACHRRRKNYIHSLSVEGAELVQDEHMAEALYNFFDSILGTDFQRTSRLNLHVLQLPTAELAALEVCFTEEEV